MPHEGGTIPDDLTDPAVDINTGEFDTSLEAELGRLFDPTQMTQFESDLGLVGTEEGMATVEQQEQAYADIVTAPERTIDFATSSIPSSQDVESGLTRAGLIVGGIIAVLFLLSAFAKGAGRGVTS